MDLNKRDFLKLLGFGTAVVVLKPYSTFGKGELSEKADFFFVQLSDPHWGFNDPKINPDYAGTLKKAVAAINALDQQPDFVVVTGDITHTIDDPKIRRERLHGAREILQGLKASTVRFLPGEHDAALDKGEAFIEVFGPTHYSFEHKGVHFIALDNVSDPTSSIGKDQLDWFESELAKFDKNARLVVLTHRPLFDLYPQWDWWTRDGATAINLLAPFNSATVLYGHIHQEHHHTTGNISHHALTGMMYPLPAPGSVPKKAPIPWDPQHPYRGLGFRSAASSQASTQLVLNEYPLSAKPADQAQVIKITAKKFEFTPSQIDLKVGVPVVLEITSLDRKHGFSCPDLGLRADIDPGKVTRLSFTPTKAGAYPFFCDVFCGEGHENMNGTIKVSE